MASSKLTDLGAIPLLSAADFMYVVDASDPTDDAAGSSKKITAANLGARYLIEEITLGTAGEFDFNSIPSGFNRLVIGGHIRGTVSATNDNVFLYVNEETTDSNYLSQSLSAFNNAAFNTEQAEPRIVNAVAATGAANSFTQLTVFIENYAGAYLKIARSQFSQYRTTGEIFCGEYHVVAHTITAAVTRLRIRADNHPTDGLLGTLRLYGEF